MDAAADVERDPVGWIERNHWRPAVAAIGEALEPEPISKRIMIDRGELGSLRACVGQRQSGGEPLRQRGGIERDDPHRAALLLDERERGLGRSIIR